MKTVWTNIISGWNFMKIIRVLAGILIIYSGIADNNTTFVIIGGGFLLYSLLTSGVCSCVYTPPVYHKSSSDLKDIEYEELGAK